MLLSLLLAAMVAAPDSVPATELREVTVSGARPEISASDGAIVVDLPSIVADKPVSNILEALAYLPGVTDNGGLIGLAGAPSTSIILNGELTDMPVSNLYQLLYSMPLSRLERVEIMYAAPARYHVSGAVINVVLKTPSALDGLRGQVRAGYNQAHFGSYGMALAATYATPSDWAFDLNYSLTRSRTWNHETTLSNHLVDGARTLVEEDSRRSGRSIANLIYASASYKKAFRLTYNGQLSSDVSAHALISGTLGSEENVARYSGPVGYHNLAARYSAPFGLTVGGDWTAYGERRSVRLSEIPSAATISLTDNDQRIHRYHLYADQLHDLNGWQLGYGLEYQHSDDRSYQSILIPASSGFRGTVSEDVADAYLSLQHGFGWGLSFSASAKGEFYRKQARRYWNFIPALSATYYKTPVSIFQLNFTTTRAYPSYWEMRPGATRMSSYSMLLGNPDLIPALDYSAQFSYILRQKYAATLYFQQSDHATAQLPYQSPQSLQLIYQTINMDFTRTFGLSLHVPFEVKPVWDATLAANIFRQQAKASRFHTLSFDCARWVVYGSLSNTFRAGPVAISLDLTAISPSLQGHERISGMWRADLGAKWAFGRKECCELTLKADDLFNTFSPTVTSRRYGQDYRMRVHDHTRNLKLTFIWRFHGFTPPSTTPAPDTSRFGLGK